MLGAERERVQGCAWSVNGTAGGAICRVSADIACICVCGGGGGGGPWFHEWNGRWCSSFRIAMT